MAVWCSLAALYMHVVSLKYFHYIYAYVLHSAHGFCKIDLDGYNFETGQGNAFRYYTTGTAVSTVEIDTLTGDFTTLSADVVMDLGISLNPGLDVGQIEGAFVQGLGWCTMEDLIRGDPQHPWVQPGRMFTQGPGYYKIPGFNDAPLEMNIHLLKDKPNSGSLHSSKAVGEPPLFLATSVFWAVKDAISHARTERAGYEEKSNEEKLNDSPAPRSCSEYFSMDLPATSERIRMLCIDVITKRFTGNDDCKVKGSY